jgi:hypothetical protein
MTVKVSIHNRLAARYISLPPQVASSTGKLTSGRSTAIGHCTISSWLRHCATSRRVEGSIPDGDTGIFN